MKQYATIMPAINQLELHPRYASPELRRVAKELGVVLIGYGTGNYVNIQTDPEIEQIAKRIGKTPTQVVLRWTTQSGVAVIPRSRSKPHLAENLHMNSFTLSSEDMAIIDGLNKDYPFYWDPVATTHTIQAKRPPPVSQDKDKSKTR